MLRSDRKQTFGGESIAASLPGWRRYKEFQFT